MEKFEKAKYISLIVFNSIWLAFALLLYFGGLDMCLEHGGFSGEGWFRNWAMWGLFCSFVIIPFIIRMARDQAKQGAKDGANSYTASRIGNTVVVENHPFRGMVLGFIFGLVLGVLLGPIATPFFMVKAVSKIVKNALILKRSV